MADISQIKLPNGDTFDIVDNKSGFITNAAIPALLSGSTATITPTQVKNALANNQNVEISHTDITFGSYKIYDFILSSTQNILGASTLAKYNNDWYVFELLGNATSNTWTTLSTKIATASDLGKTYIVHFTTEWDETTDSEIVNLDATYQEISDWITNEKTVILLENSGDYLHSYPYYLIRLGNDGFIFENSIGHTIQVTSTSVTIDYSHEFIQNTYWSDGSASAIHTEVNGYASLSYYKNNLDNRASIEYGVNSNNSWISLDADNITINGTDVSNLDLSNYVKNYYSDNLSAYIVPTYFDESFGQIYYSRTLPGSNPQTLTASIDYGIGRNSSNESYSFINLGADQIAIVGTFRLSSTYLNSNSLTIGIDTLTDNRTINFPNKSGTIALTSDIPNITSTDIANWNAKVSDDKTWNGVTLHTGRIDTNSNLWIPAKSNNDLSGTAYWINTTEEIPNNVYSVNIPRYKKIDGVPYLQSSTPPVNDNSTKVATTAYVDSNTSKVQIVRW